MKQTSEEIKSAAMINRQKGKVRGGSKKPKNNSSSGSSQAAWREAFEVPSKEQFRTP